MSELTWDAPGPGAWEVDLTHRLRPATVPMQEMWPAAFEAGFAVTFAGAGMPLVTLRARYVNGYSYGQAQPVGAPDPKPGRASGPPPPLVLKVLSRVHPEMRRRARTAAAAFRDRTWRADAERWRTVVRPARIDANLQLQSVDLSSLDDDALAAHVLACRDHAASGGREHFSLIGQALPVGDLLVRAASWGIDPDDVVALLAGASAGTSAGRDRVAAIAAQLTGDDPRSLDDVRAASPSAAALLEEYLELYANRIVTESDVDGRTLGETPDLVLRTIVAARGASVSDDHEARVAKVRAAVPAEHRDTFDELLAEARDAYGLREEEVGIDVSWAMGIYRLALLAAGARLVALGRATYVEDVLELAGDEIVALLHGASSPTVADIDARRATRALAATVTPPPFLGEGSGAPPPDDVFPPAIARATRAFGTFRARLGATPGGAALRGHGVGDVIYRGVACVGDSVEDVIDRLVPGAVLITGITTPAFNAVLPMVGALVTQEGGALSHPAIAARELGIPAVVGAASALDIPDGATVTVDPIEGRVTVEVSQ
ncbi:MAG TPA: PEP-utilizing enzyme [Acidimicrobiales bacterium]|nr:PEP-utilizing enzyme [Acidimicrobiales bacterium]